LQSAPQQAQRKQATVKQPGASVQLGGAPNSGSNSGGKKILWVLGGLLVAGVGFIGLLLIVAIFVAKSYFTDAPIADASDAENASTDLNGVLGNSTGSSNSSAYFPQTVAFSSEPDFKQKSADLRYKFQAGEKFGYDYNYTINLTKERSATIRGRAMYEVSSKSPQDVLPRHLAAQFEDVNEGAATGSGFFVRPDGYLVTNAHVVEGAVSINVNVNNEEYPAKVVALDTKNDLAVLRIDLQNVTYLPLENSENVRLAEEVRAFGFPMVDRLGSGIKITRGTVSGINRQEDVQMFQLDVTVNPGNSGGPVVNGRGGVVGVATALMAGDGIADMSFAVTSNDVRRLLDNNNLGYEPIDEDTEATLSGPDLAEHVSKAVALISVELGSGGIGLSSATVVEYDVTWTESARDSRSPRLPSSTYGSEDGTILIASNGEVIYCSGSKVLPLKQWNLATLALQPLANDESSEWSSSRVLAVPRKHTVEVPATATSNPYSPYPPRYRRGTPPPTNTVTRVEMLPALEMVKYERKETSGDIVRIEKDHRLVVVSSDGESSEFEVNGDGHFEFDQRKGKPKLVSLNGEINAGIASVPYELNCTFLDSAAIAKLDEEAKERLAEAKVRSEKYAAEAAERERIRKEALEKYNAVPVNKGLTKLDLNP